MGLIAAIKRLFSQQFSGTDEPGPRVAELIRQDRVLLEQSIDGAAYELHDDDIGQCRVVTDRFTVTFGWWWRERWITAAILLHQPPDLPFELHLEHEARAWLEAIGLPTRSPRIGPRSPAPVRDELEIVRQVVTRILSDDRTVKEALFYLGGQSEGYNDRVVVPEDLPPEPVISWTEERLRLSGRPVKRPPVQRAG